VKLVARGIKVSAGAFGSCDYGGAHGSNHGRPKAVLTLDDEERATLARRARRSRTVEGLGGQERSGAPHTVIDEHVEAVIVKTLTA
jgi:hypothetical protein